MAMEKQTVLYISYVDENELSSGSGVRPAKMLKAFRDLGYDMIVLSGEQTSKQRVRRILNALILVICAVFIILQGENGLPLAALVISLSLILYAVVGFVM